MDGEIIIIPRVLPNYRFVRSKQIDMCVPTTIENVKPEYACTIEEYELDSWEGQRLFYRHSKLPPQHPQPRGEDVK